MSTIYILQKKTFSTNKLTEKFEKPSQNPFQNKSALLPYPLKTPDSAILLGYLKRPFLPELVIPLDTGGSNNVAITLFQRL